MLNQDPLQMIAYQKDAVVSKTLIKKETGNVTLFAFDKGQGLSEHTSPYDALVLILEGMAEIHIANKPNKVAAGELIQLPAKKPHALFAEEPFKMMLIMIK